MSPEEKLDKIGVELSRTMREVDALKDLVAILMAELSIHSPDASTRLEQIISDEQAAVYAAATVHEEMTDSLRRTLTQKADFKERLFDLSRKVLARIVVTRG